MNLEAKYGNSVMRNRTPTTVAETVVDDEEKKKRTRETRSFV
jgi:hypothetical protein